MGLSEALVTKFLAHAPLTALIDDRLSPVRMKQGTVLPYVCYSRMAPEITYLHRGVAPLGAETVQIDCYGSNPDSARAVADVIASLVTSWGDANINRVYIEPIGGDLNEPDVKESRVTLELKVWSSFTAPV